MQVNLWKSRRIDKMEKEKIKKQYRWVLIKNGDVRNTFDNRKEAIKHFKSLLRQTLKDFDKQDKIDEYDYPILIPQIEIKPVEERPSYLSLL